MLGTVRWLLVQGVVRGAVDFRNLVWDHIEPPQRRAIAEFAANTADPTDARFLIQRIARALQLREAFVKNASPAKRGEWLVRVASLRAEPNFAFELVERYLLGAHHELVEAVRRVLDAPSTDAPPWRTELPVQSEDRLRESLIELTSKFSERDVGLGLGLLACTDLEWRRALQHTLGGPDVSGAPSRQAPAQAEETHRSREVAAGGFTTLDSVVIKTIVGSLTNVDGALDRDQLDDFIEEVAALNVDRHRSRFHQGFLDGLLGRVPRQQDAGENETRRIWYFAGYFQALYRQSRHDAALSLYDSNRDVFRVMLSDDDVGGRLIAPLLASELRNAGRIGEALDALTPTFAMRPGSLADGLLSDASQLLRQGDVSNARMILDFLSQFETVICTRLNEDPDADPAHFSERLARKRAQCTQLQGHLAEALRQLQDLLASDRRPRELASILADKGLVEAGFRSLSDLSFPEKGEDDGILADALALGVGSFERAIAEDPDFATNAQYCLGLRETVRSDGSASTSAFYFEQALTGMLARSDNAYAPRGLLARARFGLGLGLLEDMDTSRAMYAEQQLVEALTADPPIPLRWWGRALSAAAYHGEVVLQRLVEHVHEIFGDRIVDILSADLGAIRSPAIRVSLKSRATDRRRPTLSRWRDWELVLRSALETNSPAEAEEALDALETLSRYDPERERLLALLQQPENYEPAWDRDAAAWARVRLHESGGEYAAALPILQMLFHAALVEPLTRTNLEEARQILEHVESWGQGDFGLRPRFDAVRERAQPDLPAREVRVEAPIYVLVVGGDDSHAQYDGAIRSEVTSLFPNVTVDFAHTNWSSNWGQQLAVMEGRIQRAHAMVIMRLIRTGLGEALRRRCNADHCCPN